MLVTVSKMSCTSGPEKWRNSGRFLLLGHPAYSLKLRTHFFVNCFSRSNGAIGLTGNMTVIICDFNGWMSVYCDGFCGSSSSVCCTACEKVAILEGNATSPLLSIRVFGVAGKL